MAVSAVRKIDAGDGASHVVGLVIADISRSMNVLADPVQKSSDFSKMHTFHNIFSFQFYLNTNSLHANYLYN